uniref:U78-Liphistoxin-Lsp1a_1 n=1 Tax=Liphistius sp. SGP-2016 TaxID=1905180 RepID=A0A4Q8K175_9ARAC
MKAIVSTVFLVSFIGFLQGARLCITHTDCSLGECCLDPNIPFAEENGLCVRNSKEKELCNPENEKEDALIGDKSTFACPCEKGLTCQQTEVTWGTTKYNVHKCLK